MHLSIMKYLISSLNFVNCNLKLKEVLSKKTQHEIKRKEIEA
jgi:hypothetical protein